MTLESKERLRNAVHNCLVRQKKSAKEIQEVLDSLKARPLTYAEYKAMPQDVASWHEFANSANVDKALDAHKDEQKKAAAKIRNGVERMWMGAASTDESEQAWKTAEKFMELYPQVRPTDTATGAAFRKYLRANNLDPRELSSWETALSALAATNQPEIFLSPKAAGVGPEEELGGFSLRSYPNLHLLLRPVDEKTKWHREMYKPELSANEFRKQTSELQNGPSFAERQSVDLAVRSLPHFEPDYVATEENGNKLLQYIHKNKSQFNVTGLRVAFNALKDQLELKPIVVHAGKTEMTNYEPAEHGQPEAPGKLAAKVRSMSSDQYAEFLRNNKSARAAIDGM
jgi:hypothetical protein